MLIGYHRSPGSRGFAGSGFQPAMARAHSRASARVCHAGEQPPQLIGGRELATMLKRGTDRSGVCFGDNEHAGSMGTPTMTGKSVHGLQPAREQTAAYNLPSEAYVESP